MKRVLLKNPLTKYRKLRQMYERLFPTAADRMWATRSALGMTQAQLAEHCGLSASVFSNVECGYNIPKGTTLIKIVEATGLSSDFLLGIDGKVDNRVAERADRYLEDAADQMGNGPQKRSREVARMSRRFA